jgi:hypothetical protein
MDVQYKHCICGDANLSLLISLFAVPIAQSTIYEGKSFYLVHIHCKYCLFLDVTYPVELEIILCNLFMKMLPLTHKTNTPIG